MWRNVIFLATLVVLGNSYFLENLDGSLDVLLNELKEREARNEVSECGGKPADIAYIIDSSRSIYEPRFYDGMAFLQEFTKTFKISPDVVRIAAVAFGHRIITSSAFGFNKYTTKKAVIDALKAIKYRGLDSGDQTHTHAAFKYAREKFFVDARPDAKKIAILLTDGNSTFPDETEKEATLLKNQDVHVIAIGVGSKVSEHELKRIASDSNSYFGVDSYGNLTHILHELGFITCKITTTAAPTTTPTTTPKPAEEPCDGQAVDFNFVFDPAQIGTVGTEDAIRFIKTVVSADDLDNGEVRVGTITGPCPNTKGFRLNRYKNLPDILTHFDEYRQTDMASLLTDLRMEAFARSNGGREASRKIGVVFLKGKLNDPEKAVLEAKLAKTKGIEIFIVNMGSLNNMSLLESMASGTSHILSATDRKAMIDMARDMVAKICKQKKPVYGALDSGR